MWAGPWWGTFGRLITWSFIEAEATLWNNYHIKLSSSLSPHIPSLSHPAFLCSPHDRSKYFTSTPGLNLERGGVPSTLKWTRCPSCSVGASYLLLYHLIPVKTLLLLQYFVIFVSRNGKKRDLRSNFTSAFLTHDCRRVQISGWLLHTIRSKSTSTPSHWCVAIFLWSPIGWRV